MIAEDLISLLKRRGWTLCTAESCTGGMIAEMLTAVPGASEVFCGGVVAYKNEVKHELLGVKESTLTQHGAVSVECVEEMVQGARKAFNADCSIAVSGIAGPGGGSECKPVGTVFIAAATPLSSIAEVHRAIPGDREAIRKYASEHGIKLLISLLD